MFYTIFTPIATFTVQKAELNSFIPSSDIKQTELFGASAFLLASQCVILKNVLRQSSEMRKMYF